MPPRSLVLALLVVTVGLAGCLQSLENSIGSAQGCGVSSEGWPGLLLPADSPANAPHEVRFRGEAPCLRAVGWMNGTVQTTETGRYQTARDVDPGRTLDFSVSLENVTGTWHPADGEPETWTNRTVTAQHPLEIGATLEFRRNGTHFVDTREDQMSLGGGMGTMRAELDVVEPGSVADVPGPAGTTGTLVVEGLDAISVHDGWIEAQGLDAEFSELRRMVTIRPDGEWTLNGEPIEPVLEWDGHGEGRVQDGTVEIEMDVLQAKGGDGRTAFGVDLSLDPLPTGTVNLTKGETPWAGTSFEVVERSHNGRAQARLGLEDVPEELDRAHVCSGEAADGVCFDQSRTGLVVPPGGRTPISAWAWTKVPPGTYQMSLVIEDAWETHVRVPLQLVVEE